MSHKTYTRTADYATVKRHFSRFRQFKIEKYFENTNLRLPFDPLYNFEIEFPFVFIPEFGQEVRSLDSGRLGRTISTGTSHAEFEQYST